MKIKDIKDNIIPPFEIDDVKLIRLFSFYLHTAPTIESRSAAQIDEERISNNWINFSNNLNKDTVRFYSSSYQVDRFSDSIKKYGLDDGAEVNRRTRALVCKKKTNQETDYRCLLRHLRNSIAHNNVYISNVSNRKYILFEDFNKNGNISAKILLSQNDLRILKKEIMK